jgi:ParB family chromosome partitioning protein
LTELPVVVRAAPDAARALELALVENIAREQLDSVEEARAFRRLLDAGLTRKGSQSGCRSPRSASPSGSRSSSCPTSCTGR